MARAFQDPEFPANGDSIGNLGERSATWRRVHELDGVTKPPRLFSTLDAEDIQQGHLGDCWLLAAIAALADFPGHVMDLFNPRSYSAEGKYEIRLYHIQDGWQTVTIDDRVPCSSWGPRPCFVQVGKSGDFWVLLLEKAFAKFCGSYECLDGGGSTWAYQTLTGIAKQLVYDKKGDVWSQWHVDVPKQKADPDKWRAAGMKGTGLTSRMPLTKYSSAELFGLLAYYDQSNCLMTASVRGKEMEGRRPDGLIENHAYSVLEVQKVHGRCMIKLRNPWGGSEWNGAFSDKSRDWDDNPAIAEDVKFEKVNDGEFWLLFADFTRIFDSLGVSPGTLSVPKQSRVCGRKADGMKCACCKNVMTRVWCMTDMSSGVDGEWVRLQEGDFCFMCRKAQTGLASFRPELQQIAGIDKFGRYPELFQPERPREKTVCKYGPSCYRWNPEHYADFAHPWLGLRLKGGPWRFTPPVDAGAGGTGGSSATLGDVPVVPGASSGSIGASSPPASGRLPVPVFPTVSGGSLAPSSPPASGGSASFPVATDDSDPDFHAHAMLNCFKRGDWDACTSLLRRHPEIINLRPGRNWALVHRAAAFGDMKYFEAIVNTFGADVELLSGDGMTPLQIAERGGAKCAEIAKFISARSRPPPPEEEQRNFLRHARRRRWPLALFVLESYPRVINCRPAGEKFYAIHHAAFQGQVSILQVLVEQYKADLTVTDGDGRTPYETAVAHKQIACQVYLRSLPFDGSPCSAIPTAVLVRAEPVFEGKNPMLASDAESVADEDDETTACICEASLAAKKQDWENLFEVLERCPEAAATRPQARNWAPVHHGARWGRLDVVQRLFDEFAVPPNLLSGDGASPAEVAERHGHLELGSFIRAAQVRYHSGIQKDEEDQALEVFRHWDKDGNGMITKRELEIMMRSIMAGRAFSTDALLCAIDVDKDGNISYDEFIAWLFQ